MSLIAYFPLNGNEKDLKGNFGGNISDNVSFVDGIVDDCAEFSYGQIQTKINESKFRNWSFSVWFRKTDATWKSIAILGNRRGNTGFMLYRNSRDIDGFFRWYSHYEKDDGSIEAYRAWPGIYGLEVDKWYHIVGTRSIDGYTKIYLDGNLVESLTPPSDFKNWSFNDTDYTIGSGGGVGSNSLNGDGMQLSQFKFFDHVLSTKEVEEEYKLLSLSKLQEVNDNSDDSGKHITVPNSPTITGNMTISMWVYPTTDSRRQTIWNKGYSGEGTLNFEAGRFFRFYSGPNGNDGSGYRSLRSSGGIPLNKWVHITVVRNIKNQIWQFYINGQPDLSEPMNLTSIGASTYDLQIGTGYTSDFVGKLQGVKQYARAFSDEEVANAYKTSLAFDKHANASTKMINETGNIGSNLLDYTTWVEGTTGSASGFSRNGADSENYRIIDVDPHGKKSVIWEARTDSSSNADGGWNTSYKSIDNNKLHRFSVWIRRTVRGNGSTYLGCNGGGSNVLNRSNGSSNSNPYFWSGGWGYPEGEWFLLVGHVWPAGSGTGGNHPDSGFYDIKGNKVSDIERDYVFASGTTSLRHRSYLYYSTDTATKQQFVYPRLDVVDGTEPSVHALATGYDSSNYEYVKEINGSSDTQKGMQVENKRMNCGEINEVGINNNLVAFWPLSKNFLDYSGNKHNGSSSTVVLDGNFLNGKSCYYFPGSGDGAGVAGEYISVPENITNTNNYPEGCSYSFWLKVDESAADRLAVLFGSSTIRHIEIYSQGKYFRTEAATQNNYSFGSSNFPDDVRGVWSNFVIVFANGETNRPVRWYQNGKLFYTGSMDDGNNPGGEYFSFSSIGQSTGSASYTYAPSFHGEMANFKIFSKPLTEKEIMDEANSALKSNFDSKTVYSKEFIEG
tara:strand:+ start:8252 stop:10939 length:2688 start_codon:yes stop_codon:yes gene_type:complete